MNKFLKFGFVICTLIGLISCNTYKSSTASKSNKSIAIENTKWTLKKVNGKDVSAYYAALTLNNQSKKSANIIGLCNNHFGEYTLNDKNQTLTFGRLAGTMKMCLNDEMNAVERDVLKTLNDRTVSYKIARNKLTFLENKKEVLVFENVSFADQVAYIKKHNWKLIQMNHTTQEYSQTLAFSTANNKTSANGFSGCNGFGADEVIFDQNNIRFLKIMGTLKACMDKEITQQESQFLSLLGSEGLTFDIADQVLNIYKNDKIVMMFGRDDSRKK